MLEVCKETCNMVDFCKSDEQEKTPSTNQGIFQNLYKQNYDPILRFFLEKTNYNTAVSEDLTQDTFTKAYQYLNRISYYCNVKGWLFTIANNTFIDYWRKTNNQPAIQSLDLDCLPFITTAVEDLPLQQLLRSETQTKLQEALDALPPHYYRALRLNQFEKYSYTEAAKKMNLSLTAYTSLLNRARKKLRQVIIASFFGININSLSKSEYASLSKWITHQRLSDDAQPISRDMQDYFDEKAWLYNKPFYHDYHSMIDEFILQKYPLSEKHIVADFGMGTGILTTRLSRYVQSVDGYDFSKEMCGIAQDNFRKHNVNNVVCKVQDFMHLSPDPPLYDYVYCITVLHHMPDPEKTVEKIAQRLKPGGGMIISDFAKHSCAEMVEDRNDLWYGFAKEQFTRFLTAAGLKDIWVEVHKKRFQVFHSRSGEVIKIPTIIGGGIK